MSTLPLPADAVQLTRLPLERATQLPGAAFTDPAVLQWEIEELFQGGWICAGHVDQVNERGKFVMVEIGGESVFVVGDDQGVPRAFINSCRHRGSRIVDAPEGAVPRLQCPYHAWSYDFDGMLKNAPFTDELEEFEPGCFGLKPVRLAVIEGLVLIDLSGEAPSPAEHVGVLAEHLARYRTGELKRAQRITYEVEANWKAIAENYSECLHCPGVHPELNRLSHYMSGEEYTGPGAWCGGSMTLNENVETMAKDGGHLTRPPIAGIEGEALRDVLYFAIFPNCLISLHPDYAMLHTMWPDGPGRTRVECEWFFEPSTMEREDFDPSDAVNF